VAVVYIISTLRAIKCPALFFVIFTAFYQGWDFAAAKSIFARTVEKPVKTTVKTGKNWQ